MVLWATQQYDSPTLVIPHPAAWTGGLCWTQPAKSRVRWSHPGLGQTLNQLRKRLQQRPLQVAWSGPGTWVDVFEAPPLDRFRAQIEPASPGRAQVEFTTPRRAVPRPFEVWVPGNRERARELVALTLTAMLDEPHAV